ncbi:MAG: RidA family protein [Peptococcaceae bacterium]|nr:RidA family protein [Peptococcaceae bacterium]
MSQVEKKLQEKGLTLPGVAKPVAAYVPGVKDGKYIYTSGQVPIKEGKLAYEGHVGGECSPEDGYEAAKVCALNCLAIVKDLAGDLDNVEQIIKVVGFVSSAPGFNGQPKVVNGASELLGEIFGAKGAHARSAVGVSELPLNVPCEVEMIVKIK